MIKPSQDSDPDALFRHALSLHDSGSVKEAVLLYKQLLDQSPTNPKILTAYGIALVQLESSAEGIHLLEKSLDISPNQPIVYFHIGSCFLYLKHFDAALISCDSAIALNPDFAEVYCNRGVVLNALKRFDEALLSYDRAIELIPNLAEAYCNRGVVLNELKRFSEASLSHDHAIALKPDYAEAYSNLASTFIALKQFEKALVNCDRAIALKPNLAEAHYNRGVVFDEFKHFDESLLSYNEAVALNPDYAEAYCNRGIVLSELKRFDEALISYDQATALNPNLAEAYCNRGEALNELKRFDEALLNYDKAIALDPNFAEAYWDKSLLNLMLGNYELGWELYEWRWKSSLKEYIREFSEPLWLGDASISGKTLLIYAEQGFGDIIQFCRYAALMVKDLGARVILEVQPSLVSLMSTLNDNIIIVERGDPLPAFNLQCPIMSLPLAFKTTVESIPESIPYLFSDPKKNWEERLGVKTKKRIGLVCSGAEIHKEDTKRSIPLHLFKPLLDLPFEFHLLQKEIRSDDGAFLTENSQVQTHQENLVDFSDTAALIKEMDLVISVDTSVAHLAGALGRPVWILLAWKAEWRWLLDRADSPWYPSATLFRQPGMGDWDGVIADIYQRLNNND